MYQQEEYGDISDDRSPVRIFVREILDHNAPPAMDLETGQHLTRKVRKQYLSRVFFFFARSREASNYYTIYLTHGAQSFYSKMDTKCNLTTRLLSPFFRPAIYMVRFRGNHNKNWILTFKGIPL